MSIFVFGLLLGVLLIGFGTAFVHQLKQQRRQPSDTGLLNRYPDATTDLHRDV